MIIFMFESRQKVRIFTFQLLTLPLITVRRLNYFLRIDIFQGHNVSHRIT